MNDLPAGVTIRDINGPQPESPERDYCDQDDDAAKRRKDWPDNDDAQGILRIKADIENFNAAVADFDALTGYRLDILDPADIAFYLRFSWGERNTFYITFCTLARRLGYDL